MQNNMCVFVCDVSERMYLVWVEFLLQGEVSHYHFSNFALYLYAMVNFMGLGLCMDCVDEDSYLSLFENRFNFKLLCTVCIDKFYDHFYLGYWFIFINDG